MSDLSVKQTSKPWRSSHYYCYFHWYWLYHCHRPICSS